jgi:hypothetical protein
VPLELVAEAAPVGRETIPAESSFAPAVSYAVFSGCAALLFEQPETEAPDCRYITLKLFFSIPRD